MITLYSGPGYVRMRHPVQTTTRSPTIASTGSSSFAGEPQNGQANNEMQGTVAPPSVISLFIRSFPGQLPLISGVVPFCQVRFYHAKQTRQPSLALHRVRIIDRQSSGCNGTSALELEIVRHNKPSDRTRNSRLRCLVHALPFSGCFEPVNSAFGSGTPNIEFFTIGIASGYSRRSTICPPGSIPPHPLWEISIPLRSCATCSSEPKPAPDCRVAAFFMLSYLPPHPATGEADRCSNGSRYASIASHSGQP